MAITDEQEQARPTGTLGIERWVQFAFFALWLVSAWVLNNTIAAVWSRLSDTVDAVPIVNDTVAALAAASIALIATVICYRSTKIHTFITEVCVELARVAWPSREETTVQTRVVIIVSIIAAIILGIFDQVWSQITDLIYNV